MRLGYPVKNGGWQDIGDEMDFVGTRIAMNILLPRFNLFIAAQLIKAVLLNNQCLLTGII